MGTITFIGEEETVVVIQIDRNNKQVIFKKCAPFNDCITKIQGDDVKKIDVVMPMHILIE